MWPLRRIFLCLTLCAFILGGVSVLRYHLSKPKLVPEFLQNVNRFRHSRVCSTKALVLVNSAAKNRLRRQVIRETWGHPKVTRSLEMSVAFGVGFAGDNQSQRPVDWEAETFGDLFQTSLMDSYDGLTRKMLRLLKLASRSCSPRPLFIVKVDDDMFVNTYALMDFLSTVESQAEDTTIWCLVWQDMPVIRVNHSKWSIPKEQFRNSTYPTYCSGSAYILSSNVLDVLLQQHDNRQGGIFPLEDVYITGILAQEAQLTHAQLGNRYAFESINHRDVASGKTIFAHLGQNADELSEQLWHSLMEARATTRHSSAVGL
ncbi:lactosylceramide 1,3-N-acetyl-beta-D-glucosaminyltransferase-like [Uloborus diversus]|uniref:lactosylceramide 1,3-N-acetyl-beta-D-glucosaminyltransferase-like n=1 Tax=Uloborus diversus TaxID=327109 RepID=UPI00240A7DB6|nr:lactosylceramide 1,3-N-acetyl-beta-D-glucosaminyltransferase-like [Uloborus diversus]XP_054712770.1 lactosylceramide 1,3-N-acetyl-beta-D-glucosaminyltransferase-like [Uloborus diversus]XP_054712771.1 lactosylceramide 1,3-N-acetyl-beta-D-glucosaminyltransferase-like [Uloborus diversus]